MFRQRRFITGMAALSAAIALLTAQTGWAAGGGSHGGGGHGGGGHGGSGHGGFSRGGFGHGGFNHGGFNHGGFRNDGLGRSGFDRGGFRHDGFRHDDFRHDGFRDRFFRDGFFGGFYGARFGYGPGFYGYGLGYGRGFYGYGLSYGRGSYGYGYGQGSSGYGQSAAYGSSGYVPNSTGYFPSGVSDYYSPSASAAPSAVIPADYGTAPTDNSAHIRIEVPADAEIWIGEVKTSQTGTVRDFVSPPLSADKAGTYDIRCRWKENGRQMERTRRVPVRKGDWLNIDFLAPSSSASHSTTP